MGNRGIRRIARFPPTRSRTTIAGTIDSCRSSRSARQHSPNGSAKSADEEAIARQRSAPRRLPRPALSRGGAGEMWSHREASRPKPARTAMSATMISCARTGIRPFHVHSRALPYCGRWPITSRITSAPRGLLSHFPQRALRARAQSNLASRLFAEGRLRSRSVSAPTARSIRNR